VIAGAPSQPGAIAGSSTNATAGSSTASSRPAAALVIRPYGSSESITEMWHLVRDAYEGLARMGFHSLGTHQSERMTARRLGRGFPLVAYLDRRLVGTVTLYPPRTDSPVAWYRRPDVFHFGQLGVIAELQKSGIGTLLLRAVERCARDRGATELACDTVEGAEHLRRWYDREGFRFIDYTQWPITNYRSVVLSKTL